MPRERRGDGLGLKLDEIPTPREIKDFLDKYNTEDYVKAGLDSLKWSVNAADEGQFEKIMGVSGKLFHRALENIRAAWDVRSAEESVARRKSRSSAGGFAPSRRAVAIACSPATPAPMMTTRGPAIAAPPPC